MKTMFRTVNKKVTAIAALAKFKQQQLINRSKAALCNQEGQGTVDTVVTVLISIVLGALVLGGLYLLINATVLPDITQRIQEMFDYNG